MTPPINPIDAQHNFPVQHQTTVEVQEHYFLTSSFLHRNIFRLPVVTRISPGNHCHQADKASTNLAFNDGNDACGPATPLSMDTFNVIAHTRLG